MRDIQPTLISELQDGDFRGFVTETPYYGVTMDKMTAQLNRERLCRKLLISVHQTIFKYIIFI